MTTTPELPTEERIKLLEAHVAVQEQILLAMQAERIEAERLNDSVTRLGLGASDLGKALLQVDKNQQLLTKLGQDIVRVEQQSVTAEDLERTAQEAKEDLARKEAERLECERLARRERLKKIALWSLVVGLLLSLAAWYQIERNHRDARIFQRQYEVCLERSAQNAKVGEYLASAGKRALADPTLTPERRAATELALKQLGEAFPQVSCESIDPRRAQ